MKVSSFLCCENTSEDQDGKTNLIGPLQEIKLVNVPSAYSFCLSIGLTELDKRKEEKVEIHLVFPDTKKLDLANVNVPKPTENVKDGESYKFKAMLNIDLRNFIFEQVGIYQIEIVANQTAIGIFDLEVIGVDYNVS